MTDYLRSPKVKAINLQHFTGAAGSPIQVVAVKEGGIVASAHLVVRAFDDTLLEEGEAVSHPEGWMYAVTGLLPAGQPDQDHRDGGGSSGEPGDHDDHLAGGRVSHGGII